MKQKKQLKLQTEYAYFQSKKKELLQKAKGQFVLIKGKEIAGTFTKPEEAYQAGLKKFGATSFFIKEITDEEAVESTPTITHGLMYAGT